MVWTQRCPSVHKVIQNMFIVLVYTCNILLCLIFDCCTFTVSAQSSTLLALAHTPFLNPWHLLVHIPFIFWSLWHYVKCMICPAHISPLLVLFEHTTLRSLFWFAGSQLERWSCDSKLSRQTLFKENVLFKLKFKTTKEKKLKLKFFLVAQRFTSWFLSHVHKWPPAPQMSALIWNQTVNNVEFEDIDWYKYNFEVLVLIEYFYFLLLFTSIPLLPPHFGGKCCTFYSFDSGS